MQHPYIIDQAKEEDAPFIGRAVIEAERAHTGKGMWDVALERFDEEMKVAIFAHASIHSPDTHFHFSRCFVVRDSVTQQVAASASGFYYPTQGVFKSMPFISKSIQALDPTISPEESEKLWDLLSFIERGFPDYDYNDSWMIEGVYTDPHHRGHGLALQLLQALIDEGVHQGHHKVLITCAVGNTAALRCYEKIGFVVVGQGEDKTAQTLLGSPGFYLLRMDK